jgi:hypothetical protein
MANEPKPDFDDPDYLRQREEEGIKRVRLLVETKGYEIWDARSIVDRQEQEIRLRLEAGRPVEPLIRSIELDPSTTRVLPEAKLRELEQKQRKQEAPEQQRPEPGLDAAQQNAPERSADRKRAPNRYALLIEKHEHPERAQEIDAELARRQKERDRQR